jgi:Holliday junction resolvase RusA-like endonuclease
VSTLTRIINGVPELAPGRVLTFDVAGEPIMQGSMRSFVDPRTLKVVTKPDDKRLKPWRKKVRAAAQVFMNGRAPVPRDKALLLGCEFRLDREAVTKTGAKRAGAGLDWPSLGSDQDKLTRAIRDALTGVVYVDDSQCLGSSICDDGGKVVCAVPDFKRWTKPGEKPGVTIRVCLASTAQKALLEL